MNKYKVYVAAGPDFTLEVRSDEVYPYVVKLLQIDKYQPFIEPSVETIEEYLAKGMVVLSIPTNVSYSQHPISVKLVMDSHLPQRYLVHHRSILKHKHWRENAEARRRPGALRPGGFPGNDVFPRRPPVEE